MPFAIPTLADLLDRTRKAFRTALPGTDAFVWPNNISPSAKVIAGGVFEVFGFAAFIQRMIFVSTAPDIETLRLHANEYGMTQRPARPADDGKITVTFTVAGSIDVGAVLARSDGVQYIATEAATVVAPGTVEVAATAAADGAAGNAEVGTALEVVSGVSDLDATASVSAAFSAGTDVEDIETFRARILFRKRYPPHGGAASDYVLWAESVSGVSRVFVERLWAGPGTVRVFPLMDGLFPNGIPDAAALLRVSDYVETQRPSGALVTVAAPTPVTVDVTITGLSPNTTTVQEAVKTSLRETFARLSRVAGTDTPNGGMPFLATPTSFSVSWIWQAIANATGEERHTVTAPAADVALTAGQMAVLGTVTFA